VRTWIAVLSDYGMILFSMALVVLIPNPAVIVLAILLIARQQHALAILVHEGAHYRLCSNRGLNDLLVHFLLAGPLLVSYEGYRRAHLDHHRFLMTKKDPDLVFVEGFPMSKRSFVASIVPDFIGITYLYLLYHYGKKGLMHSRSTVLFVLGMLPGVLFNLLLLGVLAAAGYAWLYLICWLIPMFCVLPLLLHLRGICEHGGHCADANPMKSTWTVINRVQTFLIAPHNINYHMEHHKYPAVPHFNLPQLHAMLRNSGDLPMENVLNSYRPIFDRILISE
jgi:fatty acid desaturase